VGVLALFFLCLARKPMVRPASSRSPVCGNFGCPLPNLHKGLCQPKIAKRSARNVLRLASEGRRERLPTAYLERTVVSCLPQPKAKPVPMGPLHQLEEHQLPQWRTGPSDEDRGDQLVGFSSKEDVQAAFAREKLAAAAWAARMHVDAAPSTHAVRVAPSSHERTLEHTGCESSSEPPMLLWKPIQTAATTEERATETPTERLGTPVANSSSAVPSLAAKASPKSKVKRTQITVDDEPEAPPRLQLAKKAAVDPLVRPNLTLRSASKGRLRSGVHERAFGRVREARVWHVA